MSDAARRPTARSDNPGSPPWYRRIRTYVVAVVTLALLGVGGVALAFMDIYQDATIPAPEELAVPDPTIVLDRHGERIATLDPGAVRENVELSALPEHVIEATLAAEDRSFFEHEGYSLPAIARAFWSNLRSGRIEQGASTISQQYVELAVAEIDDSYPGKFREVAIAAKLDDDLSKERILEMYLNAVPFGRGAVGIEAAAQTYFGVPATELTVHQAATLAGMIAAPSAFDPGRHPEASRKRRDFVLRGMAETGALEQSRVDELIGTPLPEIRQDPLVTFGTNAYFLDALRDRVPTLLDDERQDVFTGLVIHATVDQRMQQLALESIAEQLDEVPYSSSIVTVEPGSGRVRALVGGRDFQEQQFNVAVEGRNQVGSSFKPFTLAELVGQGHDPIETVIEAPRTVEVGEEPNTKQVRNYGRTGYGEVTVREATVNSINTAYVNLALELGIPDVVERARSLGIDSELPQVPAVALGAADLTPLEMAEAYATFAAGGTHRDPVLVTRIETHGGETLHEAEDEGQRVLSENAAAVITDVLSEVVDRGTGVAADLDRPTAGKTGTTNDNRDAWFVGYTPKLTTAVWVGTLDNTPMEGQVTGGSLPARLWHAYMSQVVEPIEPGEFPEPDYGALEALDTDAESDETETETETSDQTENPTVTDTVGSTPSETAEPTPTPTRTGSPSPRPSDDGSTPTPTPSDDGPIIDIEDDSN